MGNSIRQCEMRTCPTNSPCVGVEGLGEDSEDAMLNQGSARRSLFKHSSSILDNAGNLTDFYDLQDTKIGKGGFASVSKVTNKKTGHVCALKVMKKKQKNKIERVRKEIAIMKAMDHPNIVKLYETFEDAKSFYLVMDLCTGGALVERIIQDKYFTETQTAIVMQQFMHGIFYMHKHGLIHRDLQPDNLMLQTNEPDLAKNTVKIIDFGFSREVAKDTVLTTMCGVPHYMAPDVISGKYNQKADLWSCGVIMFVLLCGNPPFYDKNDQQIYSKIRRGKFEFKPESVWKNVSEDAKDLICKLLVVSPDARFTAGETLSHVWIKNTAPKAMPHPLHQSLVENLKTFALANKLKKAAIHTIAQEIEEDRIKELENIFLELDKNEDGVLSAAEMREGFHKVGLKQDNHFVQLLEEVDTDASGSIDYTEFLAATLDRKAYIQEDACWCAFRAFDKNGDGTISFEELKSVMANSDLQQAMGEEAVMQLMKEVDFNGDGVIDFDEFMAMMRKQDSLPDLTGAVVKF